MPIVVLRRESVHRAEGLLVHQKHQALAAYVGLFVCLFVCYARRVGVSAAGGGRGVKRARCTKRGEMIPRVKPIGKHTSISSRGDDKRVFKFNFQLLLVLIEEEKHLIVSMCDVSAKRPRWSKTCVIVAVRRLACTAPKEGA